MVEISGTIVAAAAVLAALIYLASRLHAAWVKSRNLFRMLDVGMEIIHRELESDAAPEFDGSSVKENVTDVARAVGTLQAQYEQQQRQIRRVAELGMKHHPEDAWLYFRDKED